MKRENRWTASVTEPVSSGGIISFGKANTYTVIQIFTQTTRDVRFTKCTKITCDTQFPQTRWTSPGVTRVLTKLVKLIIPQPRALHMKPKRALVTANTIHVVNGKGPVAMNTIFVNTRLTSPGLVRISSM